MADLKPCPFCGSAKVELTSWENDGAWCICCADCWTESGEYVAQSLAIAAWNRRAGPFAEECRRYMDDYPGARAECEDNIKQGRRCRDCPSSIKQETQSNG